MYSPEVIQLTLEDYAKRNGWMPEPHSVDEIDDFDEYINSITDSAANNVTKTFWFKEGKRPTAKRLEWIRRWVVNERFMCFADAEYFATRYGRIRTSDERIVRFSHRKAQRVFHSILAEFDDLQTAIQIFVLKARQLGVSTVTALYFLHRILFRPNTYAVMASVQAQQSDKLGNMMDVTWSRLPFWLAVPKIGLKEKEPKWANGSLLSIQSGNQEVGIAQGHSPSCIHISEVGDYKTPKRTLEEGLFPACHPHASLFMVLEGTGATSSKWQQEKWNFYKQNWGNGGRFRPIFIPPACAPDLYPLPDWLRGNPIPERWAAAEETRRMKHRSELFVRSTDYLANAMGSNWTMTREYMWWWECSYKESVASHSEKTFLSQLACTDSEAFQSKFDTVFQDETIEIVSKERDKAYAAYFITGKTIIMGNEMKPFEPPADEIDYDGERIQLTWEANDGNKYEWELIPALPFDDSDDLKCFDKLLIFEPPKVGAEYSEAIDTADGLGLPNEDRASLTVARHAAGKERDINVASFTSLRVNVPQMARIAACVAVLFGTDGNGNVTSSNPLVMQFIIEQIRKTGDECQSQLIIMGFYDHHVMHFYDEKGGINPNKGTKLGWRTSKWSRPLLLTRWVDAVNLGWYKVNDPITIRQMKTFVRKEKAGQSEMGHETGQHDDNIFSQAMVWTRGHDLDNQATRLGSWYEANLPQKGVELDNVWAVQQVTIDGYDAEGY